MAVAPEGTKIFVKKRGFWDWEANVRGPHTTDSWYGFGFSRRGAIRDALRRRQVALKGWERVS